MSERATAASSKVGAASQAKNSGTRYLHPLIAFDGTREFVSCTCTCRFKHCGRCQTLQRLPLQFAVLQHDRARIIYYVLARPDCAYHCPTYLVWRVDIIVPPGTMSLFGDLFKGKASKAASGLFADTSKFKTEAPQIVLAAAPAASTPAPTQADAGKDKSKKKRKAGDADAPAVDPAQAAKDAKAVAKERKKQRKAEVQAERKAQLDAAGQSVRNGCRMLYSGTACSLMVPCGISHVASCWQPQTNRSQHTCIMFTSHFQCCWCISHASPSLRYRALFSLLA